MNEIDINSDLGEGYGVYRIGDDAAMLDIVTTANVACGFHAGDPMVMRSTILAAKARGVAIGAHPSFMDLHGFGRRRFSNEDPEELEAQLVYQIAAIDGMARSLGWPITHMKTHGALGNVAAEEPVIAEICVRAVKAVNPDLIFIALPYAETAKAAEKAGLTVALEVYADRTYADDGMLTPRNVEGAVITDPKRSADQALTMIRDGVIPTTSGGRLPVEPATICVHGDSPGAASTARMLRETLEAEGILVRAMRLPG